MVLFLIWVLGLLLRLASLFRAAKSKIVSRYSFFYTYLLATATADIIALILWRIDRPSYQRSYWALQFVTLLIGCGLILEIFRHALSSYRGAEKFAIAVGLFTFGGVFCFAISYRILASPSNQASFELERNVRTVQAILLFGILAVIFYYGIPLGRNLRGLIGGYGLYIVTSLATLAIRAYAGPRFNGTWNVVQPLSFVVSLAIWLVAFWSYYPNPAPDSAIPLEEDYEALAKRTRRALAELTRTARP